MKKPNIPLFSAGEAENREGQRREASHERTKGGGGASCNCVVHLHLQLQLWLVELSCGYIILWG
jgi:hypothetical protein